MANQFLNIAKDYVDTMPGEEEKEEESTEQEQCWGQQRSKWS
jgi:hypothetical protein